MKNIWILIVLISISVGCNSEAPKTAAPVAKGTSANSSAALSSKSSATSGSKASDTTSSKDQTAKKPAAKKAAPKKKAPPKPDINDERFHEDLLAASKDYLDFGMVVSEDGEVTIPKVAPELCMAVPTPPNPSPQLSQSEEESSHGKKLYFLFASDIGHYMTQDGSPAPVGQTIVKEAWASQPGSPEARRTRNHSSGHRINPRATVGKQTLEISERTNLFVMKKLAPETPGTDQGWIYGVIDSDTKKVVSSGNVASCAACHLDAENDRQFGPQFASTNSSSNKGNDE